MSDIKISTLNVKGINHVVKRRKLLSMLKKDKVHVALLQETHLTDLEHLKLRRDWVGQVFFASYNSKSRGVAILIHKHLPFTLDKIVQDKEGRFVIITGFLHGQQIMIGSVYAPNSYESSFYSRLLAEISAVCPPHAVLGGDFNCGLARDLDYKPAKNFPLSKISHATMELCTDLGLLDAWRVINPQEKDFTFFSHPHHSFSRIDYIFVSRLTLDQIKTCSINTCSLSDHSSVTVELMPPYYDPQARLWRMNPLLLSNPSFMSYFEAEWKLYISKNDTPDTSASTLWEAGKAFMRVSIISYTAARRKIALSKQLDLQQQIQSLDRELKTSLSTTVFKKLAAARSALDHLLTQKAESAIFFAKHRLFTSGNKPGRLLARLARGQTGPTTISSLKDSTGAQHVKTKSICNIMKEFYPKLYTVECQNSSTKRKCFFDGINLPSLSEENSRNLCRPITAQEVMETIKSLPSGKAPGPDGFGPEFYKKRWPGWL